MRLFCPEPSWLEKTQEYFRNVVDFYYGLLCRHEELWNSSLFEIQRELELLTLAGREKRQPECPLPFGKVPVYFRRSAINKAAAVVKSTVAGIHKADSGKTEAFPEGIDANVTFFKGMYSDLTSEEVQLKLWNGEKWVWISCQLKGRAFPMDGQPLSPTLVKEGKWYMLHIPVRQENSDARTAKERMAAGERICSVRFTNTDIFAMCCVLDGEGQQIAVHACRGGDEYRHRCRLLMEKIEQSRVYTDHDDSLQPNKKYFAHLRNLSQHYGHQVSREIVDFCLKERAGIIVLPDYSQDFSRMSMLKSGNFSPLHLSNRIRSFLQYKAWAKGILVLELRTDGTVGKCAVCGGKIRKSGKQFICENGHQGNRFLNDAKNLGLKCQESFRRNREK